MEIFLVRQFKKINLAVGNGLDILGPGSIPPRVSKKYQTTFGWFLIAQYYRLNEVLSVNPTNLPTKPFNHLWMPCRIQAIPPNAKVLGVYWIPDLNTLKLLFN